MAELSEVKTGLATTGYVACMIPVGLFLFGYAFAAEGRPLRVPGQTTPMLADLHVDRNRRRNMPVSCTDEATRANVFHRWARAAREECASIPAFMALARDLDLVSAPSSLVEAARRAARDEANHTRICANLASDHATMAVTAHAPPTPRNVDVGRGALLQRLALESFWDGCIGEGIAATTARKSARLTKDHQARLALQTIAFDEANHSALARDVLAYCLSAGGREVRDVLMESFERRRQVEENRIDSMGHAEEESFVDWEFAQRHGVPTAKTKCAAHAETWEQMALQLAKG